MPSLDSLWRAKAALWAPFYHNRQTQLGATASLINFGDIANAGKPTATTFTGLKFNVSGLAPVWTAKVSDSASAMSGWGTAFDLTNPANWQGLAPVLTFNGTTETITTPDVGFFSPGDASNDTSFSVFAWCNFTDMTTTTIISKYGAAANGEWVLYSGDVSDKPQVAFRDASAGVEPGRLADAAQTSDEGSWHLYGFVFDVTAGSGATVANGITIYRDGAVLASTATNNASYVAMENLAATPRIGAYDATGASYVFDGKMLGGPFCPFYVQAALTLAQVQNLYQFERLGIGV